MDKVKLSKASLKPTSNGEIKEIDNNNVESDPVNNDEEKTQKSSVADEPHPEQDETLGSNTGLIISADEIDNEHRQDDKDDDDTDLEEEAQEVHYDHSGRSVYIEHCRKAGVVPAGYFLRHMNDSELEMRHHGLGSVGMKPICQSLVSNGTITRLDLTDNWLGNEGVRYVMDLMKENCFIVDLNLSDNRIDNRSAEKLCEVLSNNPQLLKLNLSGNEFDDKSAVYFADLISTTPRLEYLNLSHNKFGEGSGTVLGKAIGDSVTLLEFDLSWNNIRGKSAKGICVGIGLNTVMKKINLGWNGFGPVFGVQELGKALKNNNTLEVLDLTNNRITPEGCVLLGKGLSVNTGLKVLKIGHNPMQTAGCYAILTALLKNADSGISELDFQDILVNNDFKELHLLSQESFPSMKILTGSRVPKRPTSQIHPMVRMRNFARKNEIDLYGLLHDLDDDDDMKISQQEFLVGVNQFQKLSDNLLSDDEIMRLIKDLDKNDDGMIDYRELVAGLEPKPPEPEPEQEDEDEAEVEENEGEDNQESNQEERIEDETFITNAADESSAVPSQ